MKYTEVNPFTGKNIDEDAPANATGPSVAGTGDDSSVVVVRKKKKKDTLYDGRTKIAKKFIERILKQREARRVAEEVELEEKPRPLPAKYVIYDPIKDKVIGWSHFEDELTNVDVMPVRQGKKVYPHLRIAKLKKPVSYSKIDKGTVQLGKSLKSWGGGVIQKEEVELDEVLKPKDKKVIDDFVQANKGTGAQNFTQRGNIVDYEGRSLEKSGMGAQQIASIESDPKDSHKIKVHAKMDSRSTQSIVNYLKKSAKKYNIKVEETVKEEPMIEVNELEKLSEKFTKIDPKVIDKVKAMLKDPKQKSSLKMIMKHMMPKDVVKMLHKEVPATKQLSENNERNFTNFVLETADDFGVEYLLTENNLKILQNIVKKKQNAKIKFKDNKRATVDLFTASAIMKVYDAVKPDNKKKMEKLINGTLPEFLKLQAFAMKQVKMQ